MTVLGACGSGGHVSSEWFKERAVVQGDRLLTEKRVSLGFGEQEGCVPSVWGKW